MHPEVLEFDSQFRADSEEDSEEFNQMSKKDILLAQKSFLEQLVPNQSKNRKIKIDTFKETRKFVEEERSLEEIAKIRKLKIETIVSHIEKLLEKDGGLEIGYLKKEISSAKFKKIATAFAKVATKSEISAEGSLPSLSPVKSILGANYSFLEIRIARLFVNR